MRLKIALPILGLILILLFASLSISLIKVTDSLKQQAHEILSAAEAIRLAQGIKTNLQSHNRNSFLYQLKNIQLYNESRQNQRKQIYEFLSSSKKIALSQKELDSITQAGKDIEDYLQKRAKIEKSSSTALEKYQLISNDVDKAFYSIDQLITLNQNNMLSLTKKVSSLNKRSDQIASALFTIASITLIIISFAVYLLMLRPLIIIADSIAKYSSDESSIKIRPSGFSEIQKIAANFNVMALRLEDKQKDQMRFITSIAHDIRNPLSSILMASNLLTDKMTGKEKELSQIVSRQVKFLNQLISNLIDTTRFESSQIELSPCRVNINSLIDDCVKIFETSTQIHKIIFSQKEEVFYYDCDASMITRVFNNLVSNALKYSPNGGSVTINTFKENKNLIITISDQGMGINEEDIDNIFKPFHRTKQTKESIPGVGLGLSASRRIIEAHSGQLLVESQPGKGSIFIIKLPINTTHEQKASHSPTAS